MEGHDLFDTFLLLFKSVVERITGIAVCAYERVTTGRPPIPFAIHTSNGTTATIAVLGHGKENSGASEYSHCALSIKFPWPLQPF